VIFFFIFFLKNIKILFFFKVVQNNKDYLNKISLLFSNILKLKFTNYFSRLTFKKYYDLYTSFYQKYPEEYIFEPNIFP
jgi:hypothetical protein